MPIEPIHRFWRNLRYIAAYCIPSNPIEISDLGSKVMVTETQYPFFLHNSLSLFYCISQLPYVGSNWNLICRLDLLFVDLYVNIIEIKYVMTSWWCKLSFLYTNVHISNSIELTNFLFGTNIQQHKIHLWSKRKWPWQTLKVTYEGQNPHKINKWWYLVK